MTYSALSVFTILIIIRENLRMNGNKTEYALNWFGSREYTQRNATFDPPS